MKIPALLVWFCAMAVAVAAQERPAPKADLQSLQEAAAQRSEIAAAVAAGELTSAAALARLKSTPSPSGLKIETAADFAFAAIDVGQRLIGKEKPVEAEPFFQSAEAALIQVVQSTADAAADRKVQYLQKLALIRADFLHKPAEAKADIDAAVRLKPDDKALQQRRNFLLAGRAEQLKAEKQ